MKTNRALYSLLDSHSTSKASFYRDHANSLLILHKGRLRPLGTNEPMSYSEGLRIISLGIPWFRHYLWVIAHQLQNSHNSDLLVWILKQIKTKSTDYPERVSA
ncbi:MAG: hypothetical protein ABG776_06875 [Cyanobacteria bacterium J06555_13]